ncbi:MAG: glycosyltransferase family 2 protein [Anaerolineae bacterium]|jgi:hypothetical protein|nr:glycosyltransferase family 2 protein [Anaerolineae bacterium]
MLDLGIVILNYRTPHDILRNCLHSVFASTGVTYRVTVVDSSESADKNGVALVRGEFPQADLIECANKGFSFSNNLALRQMGFSERGVSNDAPRYALLLNPDTEVEPDSFAHMVALMDADPTIGIAGPKLVQGDGSLDRACRRSFPTPWVSFTHFSGLAKRFPNNPRFARYNLTFRDPNETYEVDSVVGAYMQLRREAIAATGLLDETFFMYGEDIDWCYRVKQAGFKVMYHGGVTVKHLKSTVGKLSPKAQFEFYRAMLIFYRKHYRRTTPLPFHLLILAGILAKGGRALLPEVRHPSPLKPAHIPAV